MKDISTILNNTPLKGTGLSIDSDLSKDLELGISYHRKMKQSLAQRQVLYHFLENNYPNFTTQETSLRGADQPLISVYYRLEDMADFLNRTECNFNLSKLDDLTTKGTINREIFAINLEKKGLMPHLVSYIISAKELKKY